jgi:hypothetical protein
MNGYAIALFFHFLSVLLASVAASLTTFAAARVRKAASAAEAMQWLGMSEKAVRAFPVAILGLLITGTYMTHQRWGWSVPWIDTPLVGLVLLVILGPGVQRARAVALKRELVTSGMSPRARRLLRDPVAWTAKMIEITVVVAVVFVMTVKPTPAECVASIFVAILVGGLSAIPMWRAPAADTSELVGQTSS